MNSKKVFIQILTIHLLIFITTLNSVYSGPLSGKRIALSPGHGWVWDPWGNGSQWGTERENDPVYPEDMTNHLLSRHVKRYLEEAGAVVLPCRDMGPGMNENAGDNWRGPNRSLVTVAPNKPRWQMSARYYFYANPYGENVISRVYDTPYSTSESGKSLRSRPYYANWNMKERGGCDMYISCHTNAVNDTSVRGTVVLHDSDSDSTDCYDYDGGYMSTHTANIQNSLNFANLLAQKILNIMRNYWDPTWGFQGGFPTGVWSANWKWFETRGPQMPNALIEYAFHTNPYEEECIITGTYQGRQLPCRRNEPWRSLMAQATYKAVCDYFGVPYELPSQITDLKAMPGANPGEIILTWTAPGEDGDYVKAASYTVRYALASFTESEFDSKTLLVQNWFPQDRYKSETKIVTGLTPGVTYYFALKATNDTHDTSKMSNIVSSWAQRVSTTPSYAKIYGYVKNKQGQPVAGTEVELFSSTASIQRTIVDNNGYYEFVLYPVANYIGSFNLKCSSSVYETTIDTVTITAGNPFVLKDVVLHSLGILIVTVRDSVSTNLISQAQVSLSPSSKSGQTDTTGKITFTGLTSGSYTITATKTGYFQARSTVTLEIDQTTEVTIYMIPFSNIYVTVKDNYTNTAINQASCVLNPGNVLLLTNSQGQVSYTNISSGSYTLTVSKINYSTKTVDIQLGLGETKNIEVKLDPVSPPPQPQPSVEISTITGVVKDNNNNLLENVTVGLTKDSVIVSETLTNNEGMFMFYNLSTGTYNLEFIKDGYVSYSTTVVILTSQYVSLDIILERIPGYTIRGYVKDNTTMKGLGSVSVKLLPNNLTITTDNNGYFEFVGLSEGNYEIVFNKSGYKEVKEKIVVTAEDKNLGNIVLSPYQTLEVVSPAYKINIATKQNAKISFSISPTENVSVSDIEAKIVDMYGRVVRSGSDIVKISSGEGTIEWDYKDSSGNKVPSGIYFYKIKIGDKVTTGKIVVIR
jgi:N-acetylmuramoyl-L-alanine amidase